MNSMALHNLMNLLDIFIILCCHNILVVESKLPVQSVKMSMTSNKDFYKQIVMTEIARRHCRDCLWTTYEDDQESQSTEIADVPVIRMKDKNQTIEEWGSFLADDAFNSKCIAILIPIIPSASSLRNLKKLRKKSNLLYYIVGTKSFQEVEEILFHSELFGAENVAAILLQNEKQKGLIYIRHLYSPSGGPIIKLANQWNFKTNQFDSTSSIFPEQMKNFYGSTLYGVTLVFMPFTDYDIDNVTKVLKMKPALDTLLLEIISSHLNFSYKVIEPADCMWGGVAPNGSHTGIIGTVEKGIANFSLVVTINFDRRQVVDLSDSYFIDSLAILCSRKPPMPRWNKILQPFKFQVWLVLLATFVLASYSYFLLLKKETRVETVIENRTPTYLVLLSGLLSMNITLRPSKFSVKVFLGIWFLFSFFIATHYRATLTAALIVPSAPPRIESLEELLHSNLPFGIRSDKGSDYTLFSTSTVPLYQNLFREMQFYTIEESFRRVAEGTYSFISYKSNMEDYLTGEYADVPNLYLAREEFFPASYGWSFTKNSPLRRTFNPIIVRSTEHGLQKHWLQEIRNNAKKNKRSAFDDSVNQAYGNGLMVVLSVQHLQGAFLLLIVGHSMAIIAFISEIIVKMSWSRLKTFFNFRKT